MSRVLLFLSAVALDRASASSRKLPVIQSLIEQRCDSGHLELRSMMSRLSVHEEEDMSTVLETLETTIIEEIETRIQHDHDATQVAIDDAMKELTGTTARALTSKTSADGADKDWQDCIADEIEISTRLVENEARLPQLIEEENAAKAAMDGAKDIDINPTLPIFACDLDDEEMCASRLTTYDQQKNTMLSGVDRERRTAETEFKRLQFIYRMAHGTRLVTQGSIFLDKVAWTTTSAVCAAWSSRRTSAMCTFGRNLQDKCAAKDGYEHLMEAVNADPGVDGSYPEYSQPDREAEYRVISMSLCLVRVLVNEVLEFGDEGGAEEITEETLAECERDVNYDEVFGTLDRYEDDYTRLTDDQHLTCLDQAITFHGGNWELVPVGWWTYRTPDQYTRIENWSPAMNYDVNAGPFDFCSWF